MILFTPHSGLHLRLKMTEGKLSRLIWKAISLLIYSFQMFFAAEHRFFLHFFIHKNQDKKRAANERKYKTVPESIVKSKVQGLQSLHLAEE